MDLGNTPKMSEPATLAASPEKPKVSYPGFNLNDDVATQFLKDNPDIKLGDECAATVKLKVTSLRQDQYGKSIGFDVHELDDVTEETAEDEQAEDENGTQEPDESPEDKAEAEGEEAPELPEEKILGYKRPAKKLPTPPTKADFLD